MTNLPLGFSEITTEGSETKESWDYQSGIINTVRTFVGPWENRIDFINDHLDKGYPDIPQARLSKIDGAGEGVGLENEENGQATWERYRFTASYSTATQETPQQPRQEQEREDFVNNRFITEAIEGGVDFLQVEGADYEIDRLEPNEGDSLNQLDKLNIINPLETLTIKQNYLGIPNWLEFSLAKGKVNNNGWISPSGIPFAKETLLYEGTTGPTKIDIDTRTSPDNPFPVWELTHKFSIKVIGWNTRFHKGQFQRIVRVDGDGDPIIDSGLYDQADMYSIFFGAGGRTFNPDTLFTISINITALFDLLEGNSEKIKTNQARSFIDTIKQLERSLGFNV